MNREKSVFTWCLNPFVYIAGGKALMLGLAAILLAGFAGSLNNTHFDGVLDVHTGASAPLWLFWAEGIIDWLCLALVLLLLGRLISQTAFRTVDILGTQALARWPTLLISLIMLPEGFRRFTQALLEQLRGGNQQAQTGDAVVFGLVGIGLIVFLCWMVALMYKSFSVSCNVRGGKAAAAFIGGLLVAEVLSKLCLWPLFKSAGLLN